jgi:sulfite dehydrogenase (quinone) subunit SoeC
MNPALSIVWFSCLAGSAQGLVVALALASLAGLPLSARFLGGALALATLVLLAALTASFFHLGHRLRAWRAVLMWRTSWMSREVIVLPAFIALVALWALAASYELQGALAAVLPVAAIVLAILLWYCTAMIYACLRFIQEWAHPLTVVNYTLIGLSSGLVLAGTVGVLGNHPGFADAAAPWALGVTLLAGGCRWLALRRNATLKPKSTLQSATGIRAQRVVQTSMGMTGGSFNTREFFHRASAAGLRRLKTLCLVFAFALPSVLLLGVLAGIGGATVWSIALLVQFAGVLVERWVFFAQARHPQNLYYQVVS